jgi:hypothetical protein
MREHLAVAGEALQRMRSVGRVGADELTAVCTT